MALFSSAPVRIQPFFGYRSRTRLTLVARALRSGPRDFERAGRFRAMRVMLSQFASREVAGVRVTLRVEGPDETLLHAEATTDREGFARFACLLEPGWDLPAHPVWEEAELGWSNSRGAQSVLAHVLAPGLDNRLAVISDIDDTIIETGITGGIRNLVRNWRRVLAELPGERIAVPGADAFYDMLGGGLAGSGDGPHESDGRRDDEPIPPGLERRASRRLTATHRPFFYISSSPWNLFTYLVAFQRAKGLPLGPLLLRDWGLDRGTFGRASHGDHKRAAIRSVLAMYPEMNFALIGDDTQGDLPAFAEAVHEHEGRIAAVFLRCVAGQPLSPAEEEAKAAIQRAGVPLWLGDTFAVGEDFLHALGFTPGGETEQIVKAVEKVDGAP